jgi:hypothetical protein
MGSGSRNTGNPTGYRAVVEITARSGYTGEIHSLVLVSTATDVDRSDLHYRMAWETFMRMVGYELVDLHYLPVRPPYQVDVPRGQEGVCGEPEGG